MIGKILRPLSNDYVYSLQQLLRATEVISMWFYWLRLSIEYSDLLRLRPWRHLYMLWLRLTLTTSTQYCLQNTQYLMKLPYVSVSVVSQSLSAGVLEASYSSQCFGRRRSDDLELGIQHGISTALDRRWRRACSQCNRTCSALEPWCDAAAAATDDGSGWRGEDWGCPPPPYQDSFAVQLCYLSVMKWSIYQHSRVLVQSPHF